MASSYEDSFLQNVPNSSEPKQQVITSSIPQSTVNSVESSTTEKVSKLLYQNKRMANAEF